MTNQKPLTPESTPDERSMRGVGDIFLNQAKCLVCGDVVESKHRHDFVTCSCGNLSVDGGSCYLRRSFKDSSNYKEMFIAFDQPHPA